MTVRTSDGLTLRGWYVPSTNGAAVLTFPREWTQDQAQMLAEHGYGVLLLLGCAIANPNEAHDHDASARPAEGATA